MYNFVLVLFVRTLIFHLLSTRDSVEKEKEKVCRHSTICFDGSYKVQHGAPLSIVQRDLPNLQLLMRKREHVIIGTIDLLLLVHINMKIL